MLIEIEVDGHLETHHVRNLLRRDAKGKWVPYDPSYEPPEPRRKRKLSQDFDALAFRAAFRESSCLKGFSNLVNLESTLVIFARPFYSKEKRGRIWALAPVPPSRE
jgi:hypothetical protein